MPTDCPIPRRVTGLYVFAVINLICLFHASSVSCDIEVRRTSTNDTVNSFQEEPASFGPNIPENGIYGYVLAVEPDRGTKKCTQYYPNTPKLNISEQMTWIALMQRNGCKFDEMVHYAQKLGYGAVIVYNSDGDDQLLPMGGDKESGKVAIPSVFVGYTAGSIMKNNFQYDVNKTFYIKIEKDELFDKPYLIWPFAVVVGTCFVLMLLFMLFKWIRDCQRKRKSRLSSKHLKKIPVKKFKKGDSYETCAICLDDYENGDKLRVLPCAHAYHCKCIDPWLTKRKKTCPVCKRKVIPGANPDSDSESEEEEEEGSSNSERTPLLGGNNNTRRSTFDNSGLPEVVRTEVQRVQIRRQSHSSDSDSSEDEVDIVEADITMETSEEEDDSTPDEARAGPSGISNAAFTEVDTASHTGVDQASVSQVEVDVTGRQTVEDKASNHIV